jgi:hypothetical protein
MKRSILAAAFALTLAAMPVQAATIFFDDFDTENGGVGVFNYFGFANFTITGGSVDLLGNGFFDLLPGNGMYVDLDGTTSDAGVQTVNPIALGAGNYVLSFDLAGSQRGTTETVDINVFGDLSASYGSTQVTLASNDPFATLFIPFTVLGDEMLRFSFANTGGDNFGGLLDRVRLESVEVSEVPEPGTLALMGAGMLFAAREVRRRKS